VIHEYGVGAEGAAEAAEDQLLVVETDAREPRARMKLQISAAES
jgi:hypothetical protein